MTKSTLLALARAATPGPWRMDGADVSTGAKTICRVWGTANDAAYIAAASPDVIAALCERVEALEKGLAVSEEHVASIPALLSNIDHLTKAINEMPEWERAVKAAAAVEEARIATLEAVLAKACDILDELGSKQAFRLRNEGGIDP